ncbi:MAG: hypothetical protein Q4Q03_08155, partial [Bowdeniella nasicola]|nr:hypothetical protein [Bowdeniella nasicola]
MGRTIFTVGAIGVLALAGCTSSLAPEEDASDTPTAQASETSDVSQVETASPSQSANDSDRDATD